MGYKTADYAEKEKLEKEGRKVIGCIGRLNSSPIYEFDFDVEVAKPETSTTVVDPSAETVVTSTIEIPIAAPAPVVIPEPVIEKNEPEKKGLKKWFKGRKK